jgi:Ras-related protein Rab-1A
MSTIGKAEYQVKILLIGDSGSGKTSTVVKYSSDTFRPTAIATIGIDFKIKHLLIKIGGVDKLVKLQIWDTAGQERFRTITQSYYRGANIIVIIYDITDRKSFEGVQYWIKDIAMKTSTDFSKILVGNKIDIADKRQVSYEEGANIAKETSAIFFETSAKDGTGINEMFLCAAQNAMKSKLNVNSLIFPPVNPNPKPKPPSVCC